jgi:hypothetical protein
MRRPVRLVRWLILLVVLGLTSGLAGQPFARAQAPSDTSRVPGSAGSSSDGSAVQHGAQPNSQEVRPGSRDGDTPSASAGDLVRKPAPRRVLGLPVSAVLLLGGVIVALGVIGGVVIPGLRRREKARGGGTYGGGNGLMR